MKHTVWIIRIYKVPNIGWRALKPVWSKRSGKELLTQRAFFQGRDVPLAMVGFPNIHQQSALP
jgi:hypothetical protein